MKYSLSTLIIVVFCSCQFNYTKNETILRAEALLNTKPDSAYILLTSIQNPEKLSGTDYAAWCLHYTYAQYKLQKEIKSDSLLEIAVHYFEKTNLLKYKGISYYLLGYYYSTQNKNEEALSYLKEAEKILVLTDENKLNGLVTFYIGSICSRDELYKHSLHYFKKSAYYFQRSNDQKYQAYAYREISNMYYQLNYPFDSTMYYSTLALKYSKESSDSSNYYSILLRQGVLLRDRDYLRSKGYLIEGIKHVPTQKKYYAAYVAYLYSRLNMNDSAQFYLKISLTDTVNSPYKIIGLHAASLIAKNKDDYKTAYLYLEKSYQHRDSIFQENIRSQLYRIDKQYDSIQKDKENARFKINSKTHLILIALLVIGILTALLVLLLIVHRNKNNEAENILEKQKIQFEAETNKIRNAQKQDVLRVKLLENISNTLEFNKLRITYQQPEMRAKFNEQLAKQSMLTESVWQHYIDEVNCLFDNRIVSLQKKYIHLSQNDLIVIALVCLKVSIVDSFVLLDMNKNTMYVRRKTIKKRLDLGADVDLDKWIFKNINLEIK